MAFRSLASSGWPSSVPRAWHISAKILLTKVVLHLGLHPLPGWWILKVMRLHIKVFMLGAIHLLFKNFSHACPNYDRHHYSDVVQLTLMDLISPAVSRSHLVLQVLYPPSDHFNDFICPRISVRILYSWSFLPLFALWNILPPKQAKTNLNLKYVDLKTILHSKI